VVFWLFQQQLRKLRTQKRGEREWNEADSSIQRRNIINDLEALRELKNGHEPGSAKKESIAKSKMISRFPLPSEGISYSIIPIQIRLVINLHGKTGSIVQDEGVVNFSHNTKRCTRRPQLLKARLQVLTSKHNLDLLLQAQPQIMKW
jgi:hypothetical protein